MYLSLIHISGTAVSGSGSRLVVVRMAVLRVKPRQNGLLGNRWLLYRGQGTCGHPKRLEGRFMWFRQKRALAGMATATIQ